MTRTSVVIADPLTMFRSGVRDVLGQEKDFTTMEASNLRELLEVVARDCPDIALIDLDLPPRGGIEAVRRLAKFSSLHPILWSFAPDGATVLKAIQSGATGYLDKELSRAGLVRSLRGVRTGEAPLPRVLARARSARAGCARCTQQGDRYDAVHLRVHSQAPCAEHSREA
ncbi:MAG: response regulator transcription factor [Actinobacteria bacterium]|nr:MAG: response regulator transcription factor [Actinomycetota bacterium]